MLSPRLGIRCLLGPSIRGDLDLKMLTLGLVLQKVTKYPTASPPHNGITLNKMYSVSTSYKFPRIVQLIN